jgi:hypothetical protein
MHTQNSMPPTTPPLLFTLLLTLLASGCAASRSITLIEGSLEPRNFRFVTIVKQRGDEPGGWRAACLRVSITSDTGEDIICQMGVDMPIKTKEDGLISLPAAQRIAAICGDTAAQLAFTPSTIDTPMGVLTACHPKAESSETGR